MSHCETFDMYFRWKQLQKRAFLDRDFGCKILMVRYFNCGLSMSAVIATFFIFSAELPTVG
jgi:hypothetical protein